MSQPKSSSRSVTQILERGGGYRDPKVYSCGEHDAWKGRCAILSRYHPVRGRNVLYDHLNTIPVVLAVTQTTALISGSEVLGSPVLRRAPACAWFTVARHPIDRMVSAYFYCQRNQDALCGTIVHEARKATIYEFAAHKGNSLFLQLLQSQFGGSYQISLLRGQIKACPLSTFRYLDIPLQNRPRVSGQHWRFNTHLLPTCQKNDKRPPPVLSSIMSDTPNFTPRHEGARHGYV